MAGFLEEEDWEAWQTGVNEASQLTRRHKDFPDPSSAYEVLSEERPHKSKRGPALVGAQICAEEYYYSRYVRQLHRERREREERGK